MGKRTKQDFQRREKDFYGTIDPDAVKPLIPFVRGLRYAEPCCGDGDLVDLLLCDAKCVWENDIRKGKDALELTDLDLWEAEVTISNPPFSWPMLQPLLDHLPTLKPTWLLLPSDCFYNKRTAKYVDNCSDIVSVGRLYWMDNKVKGVDNYAWGRFINEKTKTTFHGRN